jgi:L-arabinonolactonase
MNEATGAADSIVLSVAADGTVTTLIEDVSCANSTCFSPDGTRMYFADTPRREIWSYAYDPATGALGARTVLSSFAAEPGVPDGSCVDAEGAVWNAEWGGHRVVRILPDGTIDRVVALPVSQPTCCAFGGEALDTLFITTSRLGLSAERLQAEPEAGALFAFRPGVSGLADQPFAG